MGTRDGFPYAEIAFDARGKYDAARLDTVLGTLRTPGITDVVFLSHGWNNDTRDARRWYGRYLGLLREEFDAGRVAGIAGRTTAIVAVFWPSKTFADAELQPGNASSLGKTVTTASVRKQLARLASACPDEASKARVAAAVKLVDRLEGDVVAQRAFVDMLRGFWVAGSPGGDGLPPTGVARPGDEVLRALAPPVLDLPGGDRLGGAASTGGAPLAAPAGGAASLLGSILNGARNALNMTTYFMMKARAGTVGAHGLATVIARVQDAFPSLEVHLAGHSFGGRLVVSAANALPGPASRRVQSLFLMQAAFSHYGLAEKYDGTSDGLFRPVIAGRKVSGPICITHTVSDKAVGIAYPLASRLGGQVASGLGDEHDRYGGIGRNGAQKTPEVTPLPLLSASGRYAFAPGGVYNLDANTVITGHSDICRIEVAHALASMIAAT